MQRRAAPSVGKRVIYGRRRPPACVCATCDVNAMLNPVIVTFVAGVLALCGITAWYWLATGKLEWSARWTLYTSVVDAAVGIVTLVALILGIVLTRINENIAVSQAAVTTIQLLIANNYPYSRRFVTDGPREVVLSAQDAAARASAALEVSSWKATLVRSSKSSVLRADAKATRGERKDVQHSNIKARDQEDLCAERTFSQDVRDRPEENVGDDVRDVEDEENKRKMFESLMTDVICQTIGLVVASGAVPSPAYVHMLAQMFERPFFRNGWRAKRPYTSDATQLFVSANFFPRRRNLATLRRTGANARANRGCGIVCRGGTCCYGCNVNSVLHPTAVVGFLVLGAVLAFTWCYWTVFVDGHPADRWQVYSTALLSLVSVPTLFLLVYAYVDSSDQTDILDTVGDNALLMQIFASYPNSVRYYKQLRSYDPFVQRIRPPRNVDPARQEVFESTLSPALFQSMEQTLLVETFPSTGDRVNWYSYSLSPIWQRHWRRDANNWSKVLRNYIDLYYKPRQSPPNP